MLPVRFNFHFPDEVWEMILNQLTKNEDRINCCRAFPLFDRLLSKSKPVWMFQEILPFFHEVDVKNSFLERKDLLACRRVCQQWCDDISDGLLVNFANVLVDKSEKLYLFDSIEKIESFAQTFDGHSRNPFINRTVSIEAPLGETADDFQLKMMDLLIEHGMHIWILEFQWAQLPTEDLQDFSEVLEFYWFFQQVLTETPYLDKLVFRGNDTPIPLEVKDEYFSALNSHIALHPLPPLPNLETLVIWYSATEEFPDSFFSKLVSPFAAHLETIQVDINIFNQMMSIPHQLPNLDHLILDYVSNDQELEKLILLTAPLKILDISGAYPDEDDDDDDTNASSINIPAFLQICANFPLVDQISFQNCFIETSVDLRQVLNLTVQKLSIIYLNDSQLPSSFNFLQRFKALEYLRVDVPSLRDTYVGMNEGGVEVQFYKMLEEGQLYESNIWSSIPTLETVIISYDSRSGEILGNRRGFIDYQTKQNQNDCAVKAN